MYTAIIILTTFILLSSSLRQTYAMPMLENLEDTADQVLYDSMKNDINPARLSRNTLIALLLTNPDRQQDDVGYRLRKRSRRCYWSVISCF